MHKDLLRTLLCCVLYAACAVALKLDYQQFLKKKTEIRLFAQLPATPSLKVSRNIPKKKNKEAKTDTNRLTWVSWNLTTIEGSQNFSRHIARCFRRLAHVHFIPKRSLLTNSTAGAYFLKAALTTSIHKRPHQHLHSQQHKKIKREKGDNGCEWLTLVLAHHTLTCCKAFTKESTNKKGHMHWNPVSQKNN